MNFFFVVGENSGDALAAPLITALKEKHGDDTRCFGVGGPLMKEAGFEELLPMDQISVIGIWEVLPKIPRLIKLNKFIAEEIEKQQPDAVITVDFPDFNFILAKALKKNGIFKGKIIHYVSPSVWAWRPARASNIAPYLDGMMCLFDMEVELYTRNGLKAAHVGHPIVTNDLDNVTGEHFRSAREIPEDCKTIGLFLGSRESELKNLSKTLKESVGIINEFRSDIHVIAPTLPKVEYKVRKILEDMKAPTHISENIDVKWSAFKACDIAIAVSGTVALELAYAGVPHIIAYKINPITALILKFMLKTKYVHLANILLGREVVPECLQKNCNADYIAQKANDLLDDKAQQDAQKEDFKAIAGLLGGGDGVSPSTKAVNFITSVLEESTDHVDQAVASNETANENVVVSPIGLTAIFNNL